MSQKIVELLQVFRTRAAAPELKGQMAYTQEVFELAATELELALKETEPANLIAFIPPACIALVHEALHFDSSDEECWERLGLAALEIQTGPS